MIFNESLVAYINLMKVVCFVVFVGHWLACIFFAVGSMELDEVDNCWLKQIGLHDAEVEELYIASLYWAF